ncbi:MAG: cytochrome P450 [Dehalococcoidia bacterium]|nr:cytochrome P450 [Dehalococcoidia bacterium]MYD28106.1 cytochrome P450 [Dehalococcoidia bacterium]
MSTQSAHDLKMLNAEMACPVQVGDVDLFAPGSQEHWYEAYSLLHEQAPVLKIPGGGKLPGTDAYVITKYADISRIIRDPETFPPSDLRQASDEAAEIFRETGYGTPADARQSLRPDLESHKQHRLQLTDPWVGPVGADQHADMIQSQVETLLDGWDSRTEAELVREFAQPLPQRVITTILGLPLEDMPKLKAFEEAQVRRFVYFINHRDELPPAEEVENAQALVEFQQYLKEQADEKRRNPGNDMLSFLTQVEYEGRKLTDGEIVSVAFGMHIGGNETTQFALTSEWLLLAQTPAIWAELKRDRSKVRFFVEEALRVYAPTQGSSSRLAARDVEFQGMTIPAGSLLHVRYGAGNRDEDTFPQADSIDLARPNPGRHLTFSQGPRNCPGAGLSRLEQNIAVNAWLDRFDSVGLADGKNTFKHLPGRMFGLLELNVTFEPVAS